MVALLRSSICDVVGNQASQSSVSPIDGVESSVDYHFIPRATDRRRIKSDGERSETGKTTMTHKLPAAGSPCCLLPLATATASMRSLYLTIALLFLLSCPVSSSSSSSPPPETSIPWHTGDSRSGILEESFYSDKPPTIFSPTGRLHPVERVLAAAKRDQPRANLVIAVTCNKGVVIVSTLATSAHLNTTNSLFVPTNAPIFELSPQIVAVTAGNAVDGQVLKLKVQLLAEQIIEAQGDDDDLRASELSRRLADMLQVATQTIGGKGGPMLAVRIDWKRYCYFSFTRAQGK
jgi:hypothetical protein